MFKRLLTMLCVLCLVMGALGAPALADYDASKNYTLSFYYWDEAQKPGMDALIEMFEAAYPNIKVETTIIPWSQYWTKLQTSLPSGTGPDLLWMNINAVEYIEAGLLLNITDQVKAANLDMSKFPAGVLSMYTDANGDYYGIPKDFDTIAICYNKAIFDDMGVAYPTSDWTWDEFVEVCRATTKDGIYGFYPSTAVNACVGNFIYANGADFTNEAHDQSICNSPEAVEALQFLHDLMYVEKVAPTGAEQSEMVQDDMFVTELVAMVPAGAWSVSKYAEGLGDKLGVVEFPTKKVKGNVTHGLAYCVSALSPNADAACEFLKFAAGYDAQLATASVAIPAYEGTYESWVKAYPNLDLENTYIKALDYAKTNPLYAHSRTECNTIYDEAISTIWLSADADVQAIMDDCQAKIQAVLDSK